MSLLGQKFTGALFGTTRMSNPCSSNETFKVFAYGLNSITVRFVRPRVFSFFLILHHVRSTTFRQAVYIFLSLFEDGACNL